MPNEKPAHRANTAPLRDSATQTIEPREGSMLSDKVKIIRILIGHDATANKANSIANYIVDSYGYTLAELIEHYYIESSATWNTELMIFHFAQHFQTLDPDQKEEFPFIDHTGNLYQIGQAFEKKYEKAKKPVASAEEEGHKKSEGASVWGVVQFDREMSP
ncbi:hypothetical protein BJ165DRAFT_1508204 [Panaeolus papilionaceus]|nr:hypothetical protein BJ165DRAFT_1508204 [Panaeolus papilionaceus]